MKANCWDFKKCGRGPNGAHVQELGVCPVSTYAALNGMHGGKNAGRACWVVVGSLCGGTVQGNEEQKQSACWECDFLHLVKQEEVTTPQGFLYTRLGMDEVFQHKKQRKNLDLK